MQKCDEKLAKKIERYLKEEPCKNLREQIEKLLEQGQVDELRDRLSVDLKFGTAGIRGTLEAGYQRMNQVSVFRFAHAFANAFGKNCGQNKSVVIGFDARINSELFAQEVSKVLNFFGWKVFCFDQVIPTPICAFMTKFKSAQYGIMITASHNPKNDNGIKVFHNSSRQLLKKELAPIEEEMKNAPSRAEFFAKNSLSTFEKFLINDSEIDNYFSAIAQEKIVEKISNPKNISMVYTALHGVGKKFFENALKKASFDQIVFVDDQIKPDGKFPSLDFPNPEEDGALDRAIAVADDSGIDCIFANDPDADRLQIALRNSAGVFEKLSGNEIGVIFGYFCLKSFKEQKKLPVLASSIVSSRMLEAMCKKEDAIYQDALTGFSNIVESAMAKAKKEQGEFAFAYEEAIGFLIGASVLDKDGISAALQFAQILSYLKEKNQSVWEFLSELYKRYGLFLSKQWSQRFFGVNAQVEMKECMKKIRACTQEDFAPIFETSELKIYDLLNEKKFGKYAGLNSDVVIIESKDCRLIVRPSGTEAKIKFYLEENKNASLIKSLTKAKDQMHEQLAIKSEKIARLL